MDYQLYIYPSSERELQNVKADNAAKQIKPMQENKIQNLYKKSFGAAVNKYNERVVSGKLIDNYYKSIVISNVPEVYKLTIIIRYELLNKTELTAIQKAFSDFKKLLEKEPYLVLVSAYVMTYDEYKELQIFFYPVADGYPTGLSVRSDLIDVTKKLFDVKNNNTMNIIQAMPMFEEHIDKLFATVNNGQFISQKELEDQARNIKEEDPMLLHSIAVETLKAHMNELHKINADNKQLESFIEDEKKRIQQDIEWSKKMVPEIYKAEEERIKEEERLAEEARRLEKEKRVAEAQKREEERLREEERRLEAKKLAEQAKRNIELRKQMTLHGEALRLDLKQKEQIDQSAFNNLVECHLRWQEIYEIDDTVEYDKLPEDALIDPRRMTISCAHIHNVEFDKNVSLIGASFNDCEFSDCQIAGSLLASSIENCVFLNSSLSDLGIKRCVVNNINMDRLSIDNVILDDMTVMKASLKNATIDGLVSSPATSFIRCDFTDATFNSCDMKKNVFMNCDFTNAAFVFCDVRNSVFQVCETENMTRDGSSFRGVKVNMKD